MCEHLNDLFSPYHYFHESGGLDNHDFLVCDICGDYVDLGLIDKIGVVKY